MINTNIQNIIDRDSDAAHVLLLNYHNSKYSSHGLAYLYLTVFTEKRKIGQANCRHIWRELEYPIFADELALINDNNFLIMDSLEHHKADFPNLTELVRLSGAKSAAFYPILGIDSPKGMIVVLYNETKIYEMDYYKNVISAPVQAFNLLLEYNVDFKE